MFLVSSIFDSDWYLFWSNGHTSQKFTSLVDFADSLLRQSAFAFKSVFSYLIF